MGRSEQFAALAGSPRVEVKARSVQPEAVQAFTVAWNEAYMRTAHAGWPDIMKDAHIVIRDGVRYAAKFYEDDRLFVNLDIVLVQQNTADQVLVHEFGHRIWWRLGDEQRSSWELVHRMIKRGELEAEGAEFVSDYASTSALEDFAEVFRVLVYEEIDTFNRERWDAIFSSSGPAPDAVAWKGRVGESSRKRKGKIETEAEAWLDTVYAKLSPGARAWANRPDIRDRVEESPDYDCYLWENSLTHTIWVIRNYNGLSTGHAFSSSQKAIEWCDAHELSVDPHVYSRRLPPSSANTANVAREGNPHPKSHGFIVIDTKTGEILSSLFKRRDGARESLEGILAMSGRAAPIAGDVEYRGGLWYRPMGVHQVMLYPGDTYSPETYRP